MEVADTSMIILKYLCGEKMSSLEFLLDRDINNLHGVVFSNMQTKFICNTRNNSFYYEFDNNHFLIMEILKGLRFYSWQILSSHGFMNYSAGNVLETHFYLEKGSHDNKQYFPSGTPSVAIANVSNSSNKIDSQTVSKTPRALKSVRSSVNLDFQNENPLSGGKDSGINRRASFLSTVSSQSQEFGEPIALSPLLNNESSHAAQSYLTRSQTFVPMSVSTKQARAERVANSMFNPTMYSKSFDMADVYAPPMAVPRSDNGSASYDFLSNTEENRNSSGNSYTPSTSLNLSSIIANDRIGNGNGAVTPEVAALVMEKISSTGPYGLVKRPSLAAKTHCTDRKELFHRNLRNNIHSVSNESLDSVDREIDNDFNVDDLKQRDPSPQRTSRHPSPMKSIPEHSRSQTAAGMLFKNATDGSNENLTASKDGRGSDESSSNRPADEMKTSAHTPLSPLDALQAIKKNYHSHKVEIKKDESSGSSGQHDTKELVSAIVAEDRIQQSNPVTSQEILSENGTDKVQTVSHTPPVEIADKDKGIDKGVDSYVEKTQEQPKSIIRSLGDRIKSFTAMSEEAERSRNNVVKPSVERRRSIQKSIEDKIKGVSTPSAGGSTPSTSTINHTPQPEKNVTTNSQRSTSISSSKEPAKTIEIPSAQASASIEMRNLSSEIDRSSTTTTKEVVSAATTPVVSKSSEADKAESPLPKKKSVKDLRNAFLRGKVDEEERKEVEQGMGGVSPPPMPRKLSVGQSKLLNSYQSLYKSDVSDPKNQSVDVDLDIPIIDTPDDSRQSVVDAKSAQAQQQFTVNNDAQPVSTLAETDDTGSKAGNNIDIKKKDPTASVPSLNVDSKSTTLSSASSSVNNDAQPVSTLPETGDTGSKAGNNIDIKKKDPIASVLSPNVDSTSTTLSSASSSVETNKNKTDSASKIPIPSTGKHSSSNLLADAKKEEATREKAAASSEQSLEEPKLTRKPSILNGDPRAILAREKTKQPDEEDDPDKRALLHHENSKTSHYSRLGSAFFNDNLAGNRLSGRGGRTLTATASGRGFGRIGGRAATK